MPGTGFDFYPADFLQSIPTPLFNRVADLLDQKRETDAIRRVIEECKLSLLDAYWTVEAVKADLEKRYPAPVLAVTRVGVAMGRPELAVRWICAYTGGSPEAVSAYVSRVQASYPARLQPAQVEEALSLASRGQRADAANCVRDLVPGFGFGQAYDLLGDLERHSQALLSGESPVPYRYSIPGPGEHYSLRIGNGELEPAVERRIEATFPITAREGVRRALGLYTLLEPERVRLAILKQAQGNEPVVLDLVGVARVDYRDVLMGEEKY